MNGFDFSSKNSGTCENLNVLVEKPEWAEEETFYSLDMDDLLNRYLGSYEKKRIEAEQKFLDEIWEEYRSRIFDDGVISQCYTCNMELGEYGYEYDNVSFCDDDFRSYIEVL